MKTNASSAVIISAQCLYPTFKEWKLIIHLYLGYSITGLYPTFEEWKHLDIHVFGNIKVIHIAHRNWSTILDKPFYINSNLNS